MIRTTTTIAAVLLAAFAGTLAAAAAQTEGCKLGDVTVPTFATKTLPPATFKAIHAAVTPAGPGERWTEIPWQPNLVAARRVAARNNRPLLLWIMDGHPLGCT